MEQHILYTRKLFSARSTDKDLLDPSLPEFKFFSKVDFVVSLDPSLPFAFEESSFINSKGEELNPRGHIELENKINQKYITFFDSIESMEEISPPSLFTLTYKCIYSPRDQLKSDDDEFMFCGYDVLHPMSQSSFLYNINLAIAPFSFEENEINQYYLFSDYSVVKKLIALLKLNEGFVEPDLIDKLDIFAIWVQKSSLNSVKKHSAYTEQTKLKIDTQYV